MLSYTFSHLIGKVNIIVSDLQMRKLGSEKLSGGTGDWTSFYFRQSSFDYLHVLSPEMAKNGSQTSPICSN